MNLKILLRKCTTAVKAIDNSTGKKIANTGVNIVPNPKPEKRVRAEAIRATAHIITYSMICLLFT
jgi:hypothetical protein